MTNALCATIATDGCTIRHIYEIITRIRNL